MTAVFGNARVEDGETRSRREKRTVKLEELVVAGLGGELLGVFDGLLEGFALRDRHDEFRVGL